MPQQLSQQTLIGDVAHLWEVKEYEQHDRPWSWYVFMLSLGLFFVLYGMFTGNFLFSLVIILSGIIFFLQSKQSPQMVPIFISELGIGIGNKFYKYSELNSFYIIFRPHEIKMLYIETESTLSPLLRIPLDGNNPLEVRATLEKYLDEDYQKEEEPVSEAFVRGWKL